MTKREAAIVSAYTGYLIGEFSDFQAYAEEVMGRPIFTHEFPNIADELKEKSKKDFMSIEIGNENKKKQEIIMGCKFKDRCPSYSVWCEGIDYPGENCISYILDDYENEKKKTKCLYHSPFERDSWVDFDAVEKALGFRLFGYQKSYILRQGFRQMGRTTAEILQMLFDKDQYNNPIDFSEPPRNKRLHVFRQQFREIWEKLLEAGIETRPVFWSKKDKEEYLNVSIPDCNNCKYLEFTEDDQKFYNKIFGGKYQGDHGHFCEWYERPVYHRANSTNHDPYICPCEECEEAKYVNFIERDKKGE